MESIEFRASSRGDSSNNVESLQEKLSLFDSLGQVENHLCLLINTYTQSLTDWYEKLSDLGFEVVGEHNVEETVEAIAFKQMIS